jgi:hypothetical protein
MRQRRTSVSRLHLFAIAKYIPYPPTSKPRRWTIRSSGSFGAKRVRAAGRSHDGRLLQRARVRLRRMSTVRLRRARPDDLPVVLRLLPAAGLPEDVDAHWVLVSAVSLELLGAGALLRSLVVDEYS